MRSQTGLANARMAPDRSVSIATECVHCVRRSRAMLTTKKDLRGGRSVWADSAHIALRYRAAERAYRRSFRAVKNLGQLIQRHAIACAWTQREALYLAGDAMGWRALQTEATYRAKSGLPSQFVPAATLAQNSASKKPEPFYRRVRRT